MCYCRKHLVVVAALGSAAALKLPSLQLQNAMAIITIMSDSYVLVSCLISEFDCFSCQLGITVAGSMRPELHWATLSSLVTVCGHCWMATPPVHVVDRA